jgi:thiol-disulfide isomerase/thioredoxin
MPAHRNPGLTRRHGLLAGLAWAGLLAPPARAAAPARQPWPPGRQVPALQLPLLGGGTWSLAAARGQPVLLNFWASWCEPCRAEMPSLARLAARHAADGLQVVAVNFREGEAAIERFLAAVPLALPIVRDADGAAARAFGVGIYPTTVAVGADGRVAFALVGEIDWDTPTVQDRVARLLPRARLR